jgi:putative methyltransferase (TIGR04325 family)
MMKNRVFSRLIRDWLPPAILSHYRSLLQESISFNGNYLSWQDALLDSAGYDSSQILENVRNAAMQVVKGDSAYERDSVVFEKLDYPFPLLSVLMRAALENSGRLTVLDFGGSLGSSYFQCRKYLSGIKKLRWHVVEQPHFVKCGNEEFRNGELEFYSTIAQSAMHGESNLVLLSGVLQYLSNPYSILAEAKATGSEFIIIDRNPFLESGGKRLVVQRVSMQWSHSSYPAWLFNMKELVDFMSQDYELIAEFDALDGSIGRGSNKANFKGLIFKSQKAIAEG